VGADRVAALVIETVGGASCGAIPLPPDTLRALAAACRERDILLVADEVMTGLGRTGRWFGCDHAGVVPDLLALGKGLSSGYTPMAATFIHDRLLPAFDGRPEAVCFGHTMAGNPLSASVALAVLRYHQVHGLPSRAAVAGAHLARELRLLAKQYPVITEVRGQGLLLGLGLRAGATPANPLDTAQRLVAAAQAERLVLYPSGIDAGTQSVLVAPPLTITNTEISDLVARLRRALRRLDVTSVRPQDARSAVA
jgi:adenosylmethionine-8-amino-7-oxononanoate aminotransferase